jgi:predicted amidophosphoribosyltransferase
MGMQCCPNCFEDKWLKARIAELSEDEGDCPLCEAENGPRRPHTVPVVARYALHSPHIITKNRGSSDYGNVLSELLMRPIEILC